MSILSVNNLDFYYGNSQVLKDINLSVSNEDKFISLIGANGSGKTTLLKCIVKLLHSTHDKIRVFDKDIYHYHSTEYAKLISYVPQLINIEFDFSVTDILLLGRHPHLSMFSKTTAKDYDIINEALLTVDSTHLADKSINQLSGGERQKIFIAKALVQDTPIMVLDEPISYLDLHNQIEILDTLKNLADKGKTIITVLHDLNMAMSYSDKVIMLKEGHVYKSGSPNEVITTANIQKAFKVAVNIIDNKYIIPMSHKF